MENIDILEDRKYTVMSSMNASALNRWWESTKNVAFIDYINGVYICMTFILKNICIFVDMRIRIHRDSRHTHTLIHFLQLASNEQQHSAFLYTQRSHEPIILPIKRAILWNYCDGSVGASRMNERMKLNVPIYHE